MNIKIHSYRKIQLFASRLFSEILKIESLNSNCSQKSKDINSIINIQTMNNIFNNFNMKVPSGVSGYNYYYEYFPSFIYSIIRDGENAINSIDFDCNTEVLGNLSFLVEEFSFLKIINFSLKNNFLGINQTHILSIKINDEDVACLRELYEKINIYYEKLKKYEKKYPGYICKLK